MHGLQVPGLILLLSLLLLHVIIVVLHLRAEQLFALNTFHLDNIILASLLVSEGVDPSCLLLHALERLFVLGVSFVTSHLVD